MKPQRVMSPTSKRRLVFSGKASLLLGVDNVAPSSSIIGYDIKKGTVGAETMSTRHTTLYPAMPSGARNVSSTATKPPAVDALLLSPLTLTGRFPISRQNCTKRSHF